MSVPRRLLVLVIALLTVLTGLAGPAAAREPGPGPRVRAPEPQLGRAMACHGPIGPRTPTPVLLVHGTGVTSRENWHTYVPWLRSTGRAVCTVELVKRGTVDLQRSVERVVHAIRAMAELHDGRVDVIGHSQGGTQLVYAIKFWPDLAHLVDDYVGLAPLLQKSLFGDLRCQTSCGEPIQQMRPDAAWLRQFMAHPLPAGPSYTTVASTYDEVVVPAPQSSHLDGARNIVLQDVCGPQKYADHYTFAVDGTTSDIVLDALDHPGPADPDRLPADSCTQAYPRGVSPLLVAETGLYSAPALAPVGHDDGPDVTEEPPLRCYMKRACTDVDDRGRLLRSVRATRHGLRLDVQAPGRVRLVARQGGRTYVGGFAVRVGARRVALRLPADGRWSVRLQTRTGWYVSWATERRLVLRRS
jgi:pimeloyl-ACP methyl ester carboxylesterase